MVLCAGFTPLTTGADSAEITVPYALDGTTALTWTVRRLVFRVQIAGGAPVVVIEKYTGTGVFSATTVGTISMGSGAYEAAVTSALGTVASGDKVRFNVTTLATAASWTVEVELSNP
jgi:hypothetical protein